MKKVPAAISLLEGSLKEISICGNEPCIYFLCQYETVVYIGMSTNLWLRLAQHSGRLDMEFDRIYVLPVRESDKMLLSDLELALIRSIRPKHNKAGRSAKLLDRHHILLREYGIKDWLALRQMRC